MNILTQSILKNESVKENSLVFLINITKVDPVRIIYEPFI
jgi:hypothetical protein